MASSTDAPVEIALDDLFAFYRHPAKHFARRVLELELPHAEAPEDEEPFELSGLEGYKLDDAVLARALARPSENDSAIIEWLRAQNLLRAGALGAIDAREHALGVRPLAERYRARLVESVMQSVDIDRVVGRYRVRGRIDRVTADGPLRLKPGSARASDWIALGVSALLLGKNRAYFLCLKDGACSDCELDVTRLGEGWLDAVLRTYVHGRHAFVPLLRTASWDWAESFAKNQDEARASAKAAGGLDPTRRNDDAYREIDDPYVRLVLRGRDDAIDDAFAAVAYELLVPLVGALQA